MTFPKSNLNSIKAYVIPFTSISNQTFKNWLDSGRQLEPKYGYPSVILLPDDTVVKIWAKKPGLFSSGRWRPYSDRFVQHAFALKALKIPVPEIISHGQLEGTHVRIVHYHSFPGECVRSILHRDPSLINISALALFYRSLHDQGIDFKGGHLGNLIQIKPDKFGLINFTSLKLHNRPLNKEERSRNSSRPLSYQEDLEAIEKAGLPNLKTTYHAL